MRCGGWSRRALLILGLAAARAPAQTLMVLHSFAGEPTDGARPYQAELTLVGSTLYGTTNLGGSSGDGTIFKLNTDGSGYTVLHSFAGGPNDGDGPLGDVTVAGSVLYGTTAYGGTNAFGTIFEMNTDGSGYQVLRKFSNADGIEPFGGLTLIGSTLYGMTASGGTAASGFGTVFKINTDGSGYSVMHDFSGSDGRWPQGFLTASGQTLYAMTYEGGSTYNGAAGNQGGGTVFQIGTNGTGFGLLHSFGTGSNDGTLPYGSLVLDRSTLYGMNSGGGASGYWDGGTIFGINTDGSQYTVMHSFLGGPNDGLYPRGTLAQSGSILYGMTSGGGGSTTLNYSGYGTVFQIGTDGTGFKLLYAFSGGTDGGNPLGGLTVGGSVLYGMTANDGNGYGTIFALNMFSNFAWNPAAGGSWTTTANWTPAGPPDWIGNTIDFSQHTLAANAAVTLDGSHTVGNLIFGDRGNAYNWTLAAGSGGTLDLQVSSGTPTITINNQRTTISAALAGNQGLTKAGPGTLVLAASNAYSGATTVGQGKLTVDGALTASAVTVNSGGILSGTGSLTSVTVNAGGTLAPGDVQGVMHLSGGLILAAGADMDYSLDGGSTDDEVSMRSGLLSLNAEQFSNFTFMPLAGFAPGSYTLIDAGSVSGVLGSNLSGTIDGLPATLAVKGNDLVLNVVPEPSTLALLTAGAFGLLGYGWRRRRAARLARPAGQSQPDAPAILSFPSHSCPASAARRAA